MIEFLSQHGSVDLGNFTVGMATIFIGIVTLVVALSSNRRERNRVVAEVRGRWIEEMRNAIGRYVRAVTELSFIRNDGSEETQRNALLADIREQECYIRLKFEPRDNRGGHRISSCMDEIDALLAKPPADAAALESALRKKVDKLIDETRQILEEEWTRALHDMSPAMAATLKRTKPVL